VVALGEPGLEPSVQLVQGRRDLPHPDLALELLLEGAVETLNHTAALGHVGLGMEQLDAQAVAGGVEADGVKGRAVVQILWPV